MIGKIDFLLNLINNGNKWILFYESKVIVFEY